MFALVVQSISPTRDVFPSCHKDYHTAFEYILHGLKCVACQHVIRTGAESGENVLAKSCVFTPRACLFIYIKRASVV